MIQLATVDQLHSKICVPGFSKFVFRVLVFRRSGVPAFRVLIQAILDECKLGYSYQDQDSDNQIKISLPRID